MFRSVKNFILTFLKCSEAWKTSFWSFWNVQKREKLLFGLFALCRSMKIFFLVFLQCAEAWKTSFWPFCSVQKREKLLFGLFAVCRSVFFKFRRPTIGFFQLLVDRRRTCFMNFLLYLSCLHPMDCCQTPLRQRRGHAWLVRHLLDPGLLQWGQRDR